MQLSLAASVRKRADRRRRFEREKLDSTRDQQVVGNTQNSGLRATHGTLLQKAQRSNGALKKQKRPADESKQNVALTTHHVNNNPCYIYNFHPDACVKQCKIQCVDPQKKFHHRALQSISHPTHNKFICMTSQNGDLNEDESQPSHDWSHDFYQKTRALLGPSVCRQLAIYPLPSDFCLSVIVPIFNECKTIAGVVQRLRQTGLPLQIILVNDGSRDGTADAVDHFASDHDVEVLHHQTNQGKGAAIRTGAKMATGSVIVIQDADREYDPSDFRLLLQPILAGEADVAYGTRYGHCDRSLSPWWHQAVNNTLTLLASVAIGVRLSDVETCYKMARRESFERILDDLKENRFGIEIELTARWARAGLEFTERPIRYHHRWYDEGKKIGWRDGVSALWCIVKYGVLRK